MKRVIVFLPLLLLSPISLISAETIVLKSGKSVEGKIIERAGNYVKVDIEGVPITYYLDEIKSVNGKDVSAIENLWSQIKAGEYPDIEIAGDEKFINQVKAALSLIKSKASDDYVSIKKYIRKIQESYHSGMVANSEIPTFYLTAKSALNSLTWCAGIIAHDSYHSKLYNDYKAANGEPVPDSIWIGRDAEMKCLKYQARVLSNIGAPESEIDYVNSLDGSYAEVDYDKRNW